MKEDTIVFNNDKVLLHQIESEAVLVSLDKAVILSVNETGRDLIKIIQENPGISGNDIVHRLALLYDKDSGDIRNDVEEFLAQLKDHDVIV
jgi:hypothetical protein